MMEKTIALSQRETYIPNRFTSFLWWLSTAEKELLSDAVVDRNRHKIIGMTVLSTWAFATLAWTYFLVLLPLLPGLPFHWDYLWALLF